MASSPIQKKRRETKREVKTKLTYSTGTQFRPVAREAAVLAIWRKKVKVGDDVFIRSVGQTMSLNDPQTEGTVVEINFEECFAVIRNVAGDTYLPLIDVLYIELLCRDAKKIRKAIECDEKRRRTTYDQKTSCARVVENIWSRVRPGTPVYVSIAGEPFASTVVEVDFRRGFVGLLSPSGLTYVPLASLRSVRILSSRTRTSSTYRKSSPLIVSKKEDKYDEYEEDEEGLCDA